jgi:HPt (histidine-containing phosphotransfer) domain-containing protein
MTAAVDRGAVRQLEEQLGRDGLAGLVTTFFERTPERLAGLCTALAARDAVALRDAAHSLKGAARSFGAAEMGEIASQIETESAAGSLEGAHARVAALAVSFERTRSELESQLSRGEPNGAAAGLLPEHDPVVRGMHIAQLEARVASLERSLAALRARLDA